LRMNFVTVENDFFIGEGNVCVLEFF